MQTPIILAHRGLANQAPENTPAAFQQAFAHGLGIETDLRVSADGEIVLIHDASVERTTNGQGAVADQTLAQLQTLDAGSWYNAHFAEERIPTLAQLLELATSPDAPAVMLGLEIKATGPAMLEQLCAALDEHALFDRVLSFGAPFREAAFGDQLKAIDTRFPICVRADEPHAWPDAVADSRADWIYTRFVPSRAQVVQAHDTGKRVLASAAPVMGHEPENWLAVREVGVDALITDYPLACRQVYGGEQS